LQPAFNAEMRQKARNLAAKRVAAEGLAPARQTLVPLAAASARTAPESSGSRQRLKRPAGDERPQTRRQRQRPLTSRRADAAGVQTDCWAARPGGRTLLILKWGWSTARGASASGVDMLGMVWRFGCCRADILTMWWHVSVRRHLLNLLPSLCRFDCATAAPHWGAHVCCISVQRTAQLLRCSAAGRVTLARHFPAAA
jgi:hypothetical protein